jgi:hypothetical protein
MSDMSGEFLESVRAEQASEPEPKTNSEQLAEIEGQAEPVQVREGRWKTRDGEVRNVTPTPEGDGLAERWPWWDAADRHFWRANGRYYFDGKGPLDLVAYLGPIEPEPEPQPQPERQATQYTPPEGWRLVETHEELDIPGRDQYVRGPNRYIRPIDPQPQPQPADTADELRSEIHYLQRELGEAIQGRDLFAAANREQADKIGALQGEARDLNMEIGGLQRQLAVAKEELTIAAADRQRLQIELDAAQQVPADSPELRRVVELETLVEKHVDTIGRMQQEIQQQQRELQKRALRIFDLDTISTAQEKAVVDAGKQNDELRAAIDAADKQLDQKDAQIRDLRIELDAAQQVPQANDKLAQLEALQPMAAACSTVQTMVRDMLGHMRCLVSLNSTTDRSNFCTLLESILEVFDDVECDDDETSEAEQG